jgi:MYXO-CTERM domain-containing protein
LVAELCGSESLDPAGETGGETGEDTGDVPPDGDSGDADSGDVDDATAGDTTASEDDEGGSSGDAPEAESGLGDRGCSCGAATPSWRGGWFSLLVLLAIGRRARRRIS